MKFIRIKAKNKLSIIFSLFTGLIIFVLLTSRIDYKPRSDNDLSRLAGIVSVARYDELFIDSTIQKITVDRVLYDAVYYSSKPPVLNFVIGKIIHYIFLVKPELINNDVPIYMMAVFLTVTIPLCLLFFFFQLLLSDFKLSRISLSIVFWSALLILGTLLFSYSRHINNHVITALLQVILFSLLFSRNKIAYFNSIRIDLQLIFIGFIMSLIFALDLSYSFIILPISLVFLILNYKIRFSKKAVFECLFFLCAGFFPVAFLHFCLNYVQFGTILPPQLLQSTYFDYFGSKLIGIHATGIQEQAHPFIIRLINYTVGTYGIFLYQPLLIMAFVSKKRFQNQAFIYVILIASFYIFLTTIMTNDYGGASFGPRRFIPFIPLLYYFSVLNIRDMFNRLSFSYRLLVIFLIMMNFSISVLGHVNPWENWNYYDGSKKRLYFPLLFTIRKVLRWDKIDWLLPL